MATFPPANSGTSGSSESPRNTHSMDACPAGFKRGDYNFAFLDLEKTSRLQTTSYVLYHRVLKKNIFSG